MNESIEIIDNHLLKCGEGPIWDVRNQQLFWTDSEGTVVFKRSYGGPTEIILQGFQVSAVALHADGGLVLGSHDGFYHYSENGRLNELCTACDGSPIRMINDIIADPEGRIYGGQEVFHDDRPYDPGYLYMVDLDGKASVVEEGLHISNGMGFSPDLDTFYLTDTIVRKIYAFDYLRVDGSISRRRDLIDVPREFGMPDGLTVDAEGYLWTALFLGNRLCRFDPDGKLERTIDLPIAQPTSMAFGGPQMNELYITSANLFWETPLAPLGHDFQSPRGAPLMKLKTQVSGRAESLARIKIKSTST